MSDLWIKIHRYLDRLSIPSNGNRLQRYSFVFLVTIIFLIIQLVLENIIGKDIPFIFSLFIVIVSAWFGGFGPGILATIITGFITYYVFLGPRFTLIGVENISNVFVIFVYFLEGLFISIISESHRKNDLQKVEFLGVISHELKNPLTSIRGYAELIQKLSIKNKEKKVSDFAARIDQQVKQVIEMINEMLDITKIETGRLTYQDEIFDFTELIKEIIANQQVTTKSQKITLAGKTKYLMHGDRYRIGQILTNLISNSIKYAPNSKKIILKVKGKKKSIILSVQDFGPGIEIDDQSKLFKPYFRAKNSDSAKGTGIGLYISSQIASRHSGKIWVKSSLTRGSIFYLQLPTNKGVSEL